MPCLSLDAVVRKALATEDTAFLQFWCCGLEISIILEKGAHARELSEKGKLFPLVVTW